MCSSPSVSRLSARRRRLEADIDPAARPEQGCTFRADPSQFLKAQARVRQSIHDRVKKLAAARYSEADGLAEGAAIVRRNFIDEEIFGKLEQAKVAPARLSSDEEFVRRILSRSHRTHPLRCPGKRIRPEHRLR